MKFRNGHAAALVLAAWTAVIPGPARAAAGAAQAPVPLAIVGADTVTTADLQLELNVMLRSVAGAPSPARPEPGAVLTRLIQNSLLVQEGYRMGIAKRFSVVNQVRDVVREKSMIALLDSVAGTAPLDAPDYEQARRDAVDSFVEGLKRTYDVKVDSVLLASLDYGSDDPVVYQQLRESDAVLATLPGRVLRVRGLTQTIRWEEFHGIAGRPDAAEVRDKIFKTWLAETLIMHEAANLGFDRRPEVVASARAVERALVHEETFGALVSTDFEPTEDEIVAYYKANPEQFTPAPNIKLQSVLVNAEEPARIFCDRLRQGAKLSWLVKRTPEVVDGPPPFPPDWYPCTKLGVQPGDARVGFVPEPYEIPGGAWVAAVVTEVQASPPTPLDQCRQQVLALMRGDYLRDTIIDVIKRLEDAAEIRVLPGAEAVVRQHVDAAFSTLATE